MNRFWWVRSVIYRTGPPDRRTGPISTKNTGPGRFLKFQCCKINLFPIETLPLNVSREKIIEINQRGKSEVVQGFYY